MNNIKLSKYSFNIDGKKTCQAFTKDRTLSICIYVYFFFVRNDDKNETVQTLTLKICGEIDGCLSFTEHVIAYVDFIFYRSFSMELELCSPMKTCSLLLNKHGINKSLQTKKIRRKWNFMSLQFWGENPSGKWILRMYQTSTETSRKGI